MADLMAEQQQHPEPQGLIQTAGGRPFYVLKPDPQHIHWDDVAHHLAQRNRFNGACRFPYSVAQHSVLGAIEVEDILTRLGTFSRLDIVTASLYFTVHDGAEAFVPDFARPVKKAPEYAGAMQVEDRIQRAVYQAAWLDPDAVPAIVKEVDRRMLRTEQRDLMPPPMPGEEREDVLPFSKQIHFWPFEVARDLWFETFHTYQDELQRILKAASRA